MPVGSTAQQSAGARTESSQSARSDILPDRSDLSREISPNIQPISFRVSVLLTRLGPRTQTGETYNGLFSSLISIYCRIISTGHTQGGTGEEIQDIICLLTKTLLSLQDYTTYLLSISFFYLPLNRRWHSDNLHTNNKKQNAAVDYSAACPVNHSGSEWGLSSI